MSNPHTEPARPDPNRAAVSPHGTFADPGLGLHGRPGAAPQPLSVTLPPPPGLRRGITPGAVARALAHCWRTAVPVGLALAVLGGTAAWVLRPAKVTSATLIRVAPASATRVLQESARPPGENDSGYMRTQLNLIRSRPVLRAALKEEAVQRLPVVARQPDPLAWLERDLTVQQVEGTEIIRLSLTTRGDGTGLDGVVNAVATAYLAAVERTEHATQLAHLSELRKVYATAEDKVRQQREALLRLTRTLKGADAQVLSLKQKVLIDEYGVLKRELAGTSTRVRELEVRLAGYRSRLSPAGGPPAAGQPDPGPADALVERDVDTDPRVQAQQARVAALAEAAAVTRDRVVGPDHPGVRRAKQDHEAAVKALDALRAERRAALADRHRSATRATAEQMVRDAEAELDLLAKQRKALEAEAAGLRAEVDKLGLESVELDLKRAEVDRSELFVKSIWEQKERLEAELLGNDLHRVSVLAPAEEPVVPGRMGRAQEAAGVGLAGLLAGLLGVAVWELRRGRVYDPADVAQGLRLPLLGAIPALRDLPPREAVRLAGGPGDRYRAGLAESVDGIRTRLLSARLRGPCPVVLVTSPSPGEGKTTLATQLAASLARAGFRTLLVDGDLRCPSLHQMFGVPLTPGLGDALAGGAAPPVCPTGLANLHLMAAGRFDPVAAAGLARDRLAGLLAGVRPQYDFVVIDSSPLMLVPDGLMIGRSVDGVVFSVRPGVSQIADVYTAYERVCENHLPFVGVVVNGVTRVGTYARGYGDSRRGADSATAARVAAAPDPTVQPPPPGTGLAPAGGR
ncbi:MAG: P-loop NTPase [Gemmataceae bacterium]